MSKIISPYLIRRAFLSNNKANIFLLRSASSSHLPDHHDPWHGIPMEDRPATYDEWPLPRPGWKARYEANQKTYNRWILYAVTFFLCSSFYIFRHPRMDMCIMHKGLIKTD